MIPRGSESEIYDDVDDAESGLDRKLFVQSLCVYAVLCCSWKFRSPD